MCCNVLQCVVLQYVLQCAETSIEPHPLAEDEVSGKDSVLQCVLQCVLQYVLQCVAVCVAVCVVVVCALSVCCRVCSCSQRK